MNDETAREKLAAVIWESGQGIRSPWDEISETTRERHRSRADALLPVVREIVADEVDDIAESVRRLADGPVPAINDAFDAVVICRARADRLREPAGQPS